MRTVFHVSDAATFAYADAKVENLLADDEAPVDAVAVLVDAPGPIEAAAGRHRSTAAAILDAGADLRVCSNAARGAVASVGDLPAGAELVSSGVGDLTRLQADGWAYVRL